MSFCYWRFWHRYFFWFAFALGVFWGVGPFGGLHFLVATIIHDMTSPALGASGRIFLFDFNTLLFDILCYGAFYINWKNRHFIPHGKIPGPMTPAFISFRRSSSYLGRKIHQ